MAKRWGIVAAAVVYHIIQALVVPVFLNHRPDISKQNMVYTANSHSFP